MPDLKKQRVVLKVNGQSFDGFESGDVVVTMEDAVNTFSLNYIADGKNPGKRSIYPGDECELLINPGGGLESLIKGYVDTIDDDDDPGTIRLSCAGRSKVADLVDCSAITKPGSWKKAGLSKIAKDIASPFGVKVTIDGSAGASFETFSVVTGESPFEAIQRAATKRGMYCFSVGDGLVIAKAGSKSSGATLTRSKNYVRASRTDSWYSRYSEYIYRGQVRGTDSANGKAASQNKSSVKDPTINRHRPLLLQSSGSADDLKARAEVERNQRAGRGEVITVLCDGWGTDAGKAWRPNTTVSFKSDVLGVDAKMLIVSATYRFGPYVSREAELRLMRVEAFDIRDYPKTKRGAKLT